MTLAACSAPCSVKAKGRYFRCWPRPAFKVAICDLKTTSSPHDLPPCSPKSTVRPADQRPTGRRGLCAALRSQLFRPDPFRHLWAISGFPVRQRRRRACGTHMRRCGAWCGTRVTAGRGYGKIYGRRTDDDLPEHEIHGIEYALTTDGEVYRLGLVGRSCRSACR